MDNFSPAQNIMLALLRSSLWDPSSCPNVPADTDWPAVWQELRHQTVDGLVIDQLILRDPARKVSYFQRTSQRLSFFFSLMGVQQEICDLLQNSGISVAVLKGSAAAVYYPQPSYRTMGDIDLIVLPQDFDRANDILAKLGCKPIEHDNYRHTEWRYKGILIELHRYFSLFKNDAVSLRMDEIIFGGIPQAQTITMEGFSFPMLPPPENGVVLLQHISQHMEQGLGLRQIIDWMLFVDRELDDQRWHAEFQASARDIGLETLAITTTRMCQMYLGLREDLTWCNGAEDDLCLDLMTYVLAQGNFGRKHGGSQTKSVFVLNAARNLPHFFRFLQHTGCTTWNALKKRPWLKPFAWFYQLCRYIRLGFQAESPLKNLWTSVKISRNRDVFLDRLGVARRVKNDSFPPH